MEGILTGTSKQEKVGRMEEIIRELLCYLDEDPNREGLCKTPKRVTLSLKYLTQGYHQDVKKILSRAIFNEPYDQMVVVKDIELFSLCEHHMLPFYGRAHVAYLPKGRIIGLSKIPRVVDVFAKRLQVQERLTSQIADCLMTALSPRGVGVVIEAFHLCMAMRGVEKRASQTVTSAMLGNFRTCERTRAEFLSLIGRNSHSSNGLI